MKTLTDRIRDVAKSTVKKVKERKSPKPEQSFYKPVIKKTRDGKSAEMEVNYYVFLNDTERSFLDGSRGDVDELEKRIGKIVRKKISKKKKTLDLVIENQQGTKEKTQVSISAFSKFLYDEEKGIICAVSKKKKLKNSPSLTTIPARVNRFRNFGKKRNRPRSATKNISDSFMIKAYSTIGDRKEEEFTSEAITAESPVSINLQSELVPERIRGIETPYPLVSDIYVEVSEGRIIGYFFFNKLRAILENSIDHGVASLSGGYSKDIKLELYIRTYNREHDSKRVDVLTEIGTFSFDEEITMYRFELPVKYGELSFYVEYETFDASVEYAKEQVKKVGDTILLLESNPQDLESTTRVYEAYNTSRVLQGQPSSSYKDFTRYITENTEEFQSIQGDIGQYLTKSLASLKEKFFLVQNDTGDLVSKINTISRKQVNFPKVQISSRNPLKNRFEENHSFDEVIRISNILKSANFVKTQNLLVPIKSSSDPDNNDIDPHLVIEKIRKIGKDINQSGDHTGSIYILKGFSRSLEDNVSLLKSPVWISIDAAKTELIQGKYLAKAILRDKDNNSAEEFFMVTK